MAEKFTEIRWHGRGGQGTVTAAKLFAETMVDNGHYAQAFPEYGPERMGAPLMAYNRISDQPLTIHCQVTHPRIVAVVDATLLRVANVLEGMPNHGILIVNTHKSATEIKEKLCAEKQQVFVVDATKISLETLGRPLPNTPMLGALVRVSGNIELDDLLEHIRQNFSKKFSSKVVEGNILAVERAYEEVRGEGE